MDGGILARSWMDGSQANLAPGSHPARFLAGLAQALLPLRHPAQIFQVVSQQVGTCLQVDRCFMEETGASAVYADYHPGLASLEGMHRLPGYPPVIEAQLARGNPVIIADTRVCDLSGDRDAIDQLGAQALVIVPYIRDGSRAGSLVVTRCSAYTWPEEEIALLQFTSSLAWPAVEHARLNSRRESSEEALRFAAAQTGLVLFTSDLDLRYTWVFEAGNDGQPSSLLGKRDQDFLPACDAIRLSAAKRRVLETGASLRLDCEILLPDGKRVYDLRMEPLRSDSGEIIGLTGSAICVTERRQAEECARRNAVELETTRHVLSEQEMERLQLAQNLHDGPLQSVLALLIDVNGLMLVENKPEQMEKLDGIRIRLQDLARDLRGFTTELKPPALAPFGLEKAIRSHLENFQANFPDFLIQLELMPDGQTLPENVRLAMFRVYQELLENIVHHASASRITIHLTLDEAQTELEIQDDGLGFEMPSSRLELARQGHLGLVRVLERVEALGGRVVICASPGNGTLVRIVIPYLPPPPVTEDPGGMP